jgi:WD40 repeat protein
VIVWDVDRKEQVGSCPLPAPPAPKVKPWRIRHKLEACSADGRLVAFSYQKGEQERVLKVWEVPGGKELVERTFPSVGLLNVQFSPNGRLLTYETFKKFGDRPITCILDLESGEDLLTFPNLAPRTSKLNTQPTHAVSPDGKLLVRWEENTFNTLLRRGKSIDIVVQDMARKEEFRPLGHTLPVKSVAFSPDGQRLASLGAWQESFSPFSRKEIKIWDLHNGLDVLTLTVEVPPVPGGGKLRGGDQLQFSADGYRLMLLSRDQAGYALHTWEATPLPGPPK